MKSDSKKKKAKGTGKMKIHLEEIESHLHTVSDEHELYNDDVSDDVDYFTDREVCLI
jgi:hypothetical protein